MRRCNTAANQGMLSSQAVEPGSSLPNPWTLQSRSSQWGAPDRRSQPITWLIWRSVSLLTATLPMMAAPKVRRAKKEDY